MSIEQGPRGPHEGAPRTGTSGWEVVDTGLDVAEGAVQGIGWLILKGYALLLILVGLVMIFWLGGMDYKAILVGLGVAGYGVYLLLGGSWVIY